MKVINDIAYYSTKEWSEKLNMKRDLISEWCTDKKVKSIKNGKFYLISEKDMNEWLKIKKKPKKLNKERITEMIYSKLSKKDYKILEINEGLKGKIIMKHLICKNSYPTNISNIYYQNTKCPFCTRRNAYTIKEVKDICRKIDKNYEVISNNYKNNKTPIEFKHKKCNKIFKMRFGDFKNLNRRCPFCRESKAEKIISDILDFNDVKYTHNYTIHFKNKTQFVDFKIFLNNKIYYIEFDGKQHFYPNDSYLNEGFDDLKLTQERDKNKNNYFENKKIYLYRIAYTHFNNLEEIICNILNEKITPEFNDYPLGEYAKVCGNDNYSYIVFIG